MTTPIKLSSNRSTSA
ncbi:hypothetical protein IEO21_10374 [Rhodonia placenta]|uniref:Uncharacterized protein n=1 Tax=Rhodonia placenta TaxID=104341 RepID=A0A8H7NSX7_9APHY|nr:hypothetical protein IEO21_10374 [Postia placenta]